MNIFDLRSMKKIYDFTFQIYGKQRSSFLEH